MAPSPSPKVAAARARLANASRYGDTLRADAARLDLKAERLAEFITRTVESSPTLTSAQRDRLTLLLRGGDAA
ncbi:MAG: hypothetical protein M3Y71_11510 [Actinomycetota bacterium]|nr:hypothetical protein [Actinomycetota bacterium]